MDTYKMIQEAKELREKDSRIVTITFYTDGWVPNAYRWPKKGNAFTITFESDTTYEIRYHKYDQLRSYGRGPTVVAKSAKNGRLYSR